MEKTEKNNWLEKMTQRLGNLNEWEWDGKYPADLGGRVGKCTCGNPIRYEYTIVNSSTHDHDIVGSTCYLHFTHHITGLPYEEIEEEMKYLEDVAERKYQDALLLRLIELASDKSSFVRNHSEQFIDYYYNNNRKLSVGYLKTLCNTLYNTDSYSFLAHFQPNFQPEKEKIKLASLSPQDYEKFRICLKGDQVKLYEKYRSQGFHEKKKGGRK